MRVSHITVAAMIILWAAAALVSAEDEEPVYLEFLRKSRPVAHYRLGGTGPAALVNVMATGELALARGRISGDRVAVEPGPSPREFVGTDRLNGFEDGNLGLAFRHVAGFSNSVVIFPGSSLPDFSRPHEDELSISAWVKADPNQPNRAGIISRKAGDRLDTYQFALAVWDNRYDVLIRNGDGSARSMYTTSSPDGAWQHLVVVLDSKDRYQNSAGSLRFYLNGRRTFIKETGNHTRTQLTASQEDIVIGGTSSKPSEDEGFDRGFNGRIDEVSIWDRAISDAEVEELFKVAVIGRKPMVIIVGQARREDAFH